MQEDNIHLLHQKIGNFYTFLELPNASVPKLIKRQYRILALVYHPDKKSGSQEKFLQLKMVYDILHKRKSEYDSYLESIANRQKSYDVNNKLANELIQRENQVIEEKRKYAEELMKKRQQREEERQREQDILEKQRKLDDKMQKVAYQDNSKILKKINSVIIDWTTLEMDYDEDMLRILFGGYGIIQEVIVLQEKQMAQMQFMQTISAEKAVDDFIESSDLRVRFLKKQQKRQKLIQKLGLQKHKQKDNLSLSSQNLAKIANLMNQDSRVFCDIQTELQRQEERARYMEKIIKDEVL